MCLAGSCVLASGVEAMLKTEVKSSTVYSPVSSWDDVLCSPFLDTENMRKVEAGRDLTCAQLLTYVTSHCDVPVGLWHARCSLCSTEGTSSSGAEGARCCQGSPSVWCTPKAGTVMSSMRLFDARCSV